MPHPSWVRGLKYFIMPPVSIHFYAAPFVGAWIEICNADDLQILNIKAAPFVGAWIEIIDFFNTSNFVIAAPFVGAWIEIKNFAC